MVVDAVCVHHWMVDDPRVMEGFRTPGTINGTCKHCNAVKVFNGRFNIDQFDIGIVPREPGTGGPLGDTPDRYKQGRDRMAAARSARKIKALRAANGEFA